MNAQTLYTEAKTAQHMLQQVLDNADMREMERQQLQDTTERMTSQFQDILATGKRGRYAPKIDMLKESLMGINMTPSVKKSHLMSATAYAAQIAEKFSVEVDSTPATLTADEFELCNAVNAKWGLEEEAMVEGSEPVEQKTKWAHLLPTPPSDHSTVYEHAVTIAQARSKTFGYCKVLEVKNRKPTHGKKGWYAKFGYSKDDRGNWYYLGVDVSEVLAL